MTFPAAKLIALAEKAGRDTAEVSLLDRPLPWSQEYLLSIMALLDHAVAQAVEPMRMQFKPEFRSEFVKTMQETALSAFKQRCIEMVGASPWGNA